MPNTTQAAGILFEAPGRQVLFLRRGPDGDHPGEWCFPGGHIEAGETAEQAARREATEELGKHPEGPLEELARSVSDNARAPAAPATSTPADDLPGNPLPQLDATSVTSMQPAPPVDLVDYTTFRQHVDETFEPTLNEEHTGFAWALADKPPEPLHPGCRVVLERLTMDELGIARAMAEGRLTSPQHYENLLLVAMRISGTGMAYRRALDEYVWRDPALYLNDDFLARCQGLAVVWEHPPKATLNSDEFSKRVIGSIMLPYIAGDEVWGIAKVYDAEAAKELEDARLSTSPGVVFRDPSVNNKVTLENGSTLLIEGKPSLLDHLAVCELGVWDKRGEPRGVMNINAERADSMAEEDKAAADRREEDEKKEQERMDAEAGQKLDKLLERLDAVNSRLDAYEADEKACKDAEDARERELEEEEKKAEGAANNEDKAEDKRVEEKDDSDKRHDAQLSELKAMIDDLQRKVTPLPVEEQAKFADEQFRADSVYQALGSQAPAPMAGERLHAYRVRLAKGVQRHSKAWKDINLLQLPPEAFKVAQETVYNDAQAAARTPDDVPVGTLREIVTVDRGTGQRIVTFAGPNTIFKQFNRPARRMTGINTQRGA